MPGPKLRLGCYLNEPKVGIRLQCRETRPTTTNKTKEQQDFFGWFTSGLQ